MQAYYAKMCSLHPDFPGRYRAWNEEERNAMKFVPEAFNKQYNIFREASRVMCEMGRWST